MPRSDGLGENQPEIIETYLFSQSQTKEAVERLTPKDNTDSKDEKQKQKQKQKQKAQQQTHADAQQTISLAKHADTVKLKQQRVALAKQSQSQSQIQTGNKDTMPELDELLHSAIKRYQQYPHSAEEMGLEGIVTVTFVLYNDGTIDRLKIIKSSGLQSFDDATIIAINKATPFVGVKKYITEPTLFHINVVFDISMIQS